MQSQQYNNFTMFSSILTDGLNNFKLLDILKKRGTCDPFLKEDTNQQTQLQGEFSVKLADKNFKVSYLILCEGKYESHNNK